MLPFDALLFDFDGVLVDSEPIHYACWIEVLRPLAVLTAPTLMIAGWVLACIATILHVRRH